MIFISIKTLGAKGKLNYMKTSISIKTTKKTDIDEEIHHVTFKDYRGDYTIKIDNGTARQFIESLDTAVNYCELKQ